MTYRITGLDPTPFKPLFSYSDAELARRGIVRMTVDRKPSFPCRISLVDREPGDTVLLVNHVSHDVPNPFRASHAIFVAEAADCAAGFGDELPPIFAARTLALRGFDASAMMVEAMLCDGKEADFEIRKLFQDPAIRTIHAHNAARGCFLAKVERS